MEFRKGFTTISQPGVCIPLDPNVVSDHAEIILETPYGRISSWNVSNPAHHHHFVSSSFSKTHMFLDQSFIQNKITHQVNSIAERMFSGQVDIQIIIEGFQSMFDLLERRLAGYNYALIYKQLPDSENNTAILVNLNRFNLVHAEVYEQAYLQEGRERILRVPTVQLITPTGLFVTIGGVHIPGSNRRSPVIGLQELRGIIQQLRSPLIMMGDFNAIPKLVGDEIPEVRIYLTTYPTHINPGNEVSYYDMALVKGVPDSEMLPVDRTSIYTQALVQTIYACRKHYLES